MVYSILHFRAAPGRRLGRPARSTATPDLEIVWTLIPTLLVTAIGIVSAIVLGRNDALGANVLRDQRDRAAVRLELQLSRTAKGLTSGMLRLPKGRSVAARRSTRRT